MNVVWNFIRMKEQQQEIPQSGGKKGRKSENVTRICQHMENPQPS